MIHLKITLKLKCLSKLWNSYVDICICTHTHTLYCVCILVKTKNHDVSHFQKQNFILCQIHREIRSLTQMELYFAGERVCRLHITVSGNISKSPRNSGQLQRSFREWVSFRMYLRMWSSKEQNLVSGPQAFPTSECFERRLVSENRYTDFMEQGEKSSPWVDNLWNSYWDAGWIKCRWLLLDCGELV